MQKLPKGYLFSSLALLALLIGSFSANLALAKGHVSTSAQAVPPPSAKLGHGHPVSMHVVNMANVPKVTSQSSASPHPKLLPYHNGMSPSVYAQRKAAAAHNKNAPVAPYVYPNPTASSTYTPTTQIKFQGMADSPSICPPGGCQPPDQALAASPNWVFQGVNTSFALYSISGALQAGWPKTAVNFFGIPNPGACSSSGPFVSDPRAFYDINDGRFFATILEVEGSVINSCPLASRYWIAVSQTPNPNGLWNIYGFDMTLGTTNVADYTQIGYDRQAFYFSANMFDSATFNVFQYAEVQAANKATMEAGGAVTPIHATNFTANGGLVDTVQPVMTDAHFYSGPNAEFLINSFDFNFGGGGCSSSCSGVVVWAFNFAAASITGLIIPTTSYSLAPLANQPGCSTGCIETIDPRISGTPVYRNGLISFALETAAMNSTRIVPSIFWGQVSPQLNDSAQITGGSVFQSGYYVHQNDAATSFGALMPDNDGDLFMVFELMGSSINPEVVYTSRRVTFTLGLFHDGGLILRKGDAPTSNTRWGDYEAASFDGYSTDKVWFSGQYSASNGDWSTFIGKDQYNTSSN